MRHRKLNLLGVAALWLAIAGASQAGAAGIVNGGFETGDFTGWTTHGHIAKAPVSPPYALGYTDPPPGFEYGAQVLTTDDIFVQGCSPPNDVVVPTEGKFFALLSSLPSDGEDMSVDIDPVTGNTIRDECPTTLGPTLTPPTDVDSDGFFEQDVTTLSQQFVVDNIPASIAFDWSLLAGEGFTSEGNWLHDDFQVTLTPISPGGQPIQVSGLTEGATSSPYYCKPIGGICPYTGRFTFIDPSQFDGCDYQVFTDPPGGPTDCHRSSFGRTSFRRTVFPIPAAGVWQVTFFVSDDGGDSLKSTGVLLDNVTVTTTPPVPTMSGEGIVALVCLLFLALVTHVMRRRAPHMRLFLVAFLLLATALLPTQLRPAIGALAPQATGTAAQTDKAQSNVERLAARLPTVAASPVPTRPLPSTQTPAPTEALPKSTPTPNIS